MFMSFYKHLIDIYRSHNKSLRYFGSSLVYRVTDEGSVPEIAQYGPYYLPLNVFTAFKGSNCYILFAITAAYVVPCGGPKTSPRTSSIVQIILFLSVL